MGHATRRVISSVCRMSRECRNIIQKVCHEVRGPLQMARARTKTEIYLLFINCPRLDLFIRDMAGAGAAVTESPVRASRRKTPTKTTWARVTSPGRMDLVKSTANHLLWHFGGTFLFLLVYQKTQCTFAEIYCSFCLCNPLPIIFTSKHWRTHLKTNWFLDRVSKEKFPPFGAELFSFLHFN